MLFPKLRFNHGICTAGELTGLFQRIGLSVHFEPLLLDIDTDLFVVNLGFCVHTLLDPADGFRVKSLMVLLVACQDTAYNIIITTQRLCVISPLDQILMIEDKACRNVVPALFNIEVRTNRQVGDHNGILRWNAVDGTASTGGRADHGDCPLVLRRVVCTG